MKKITIGIPCYNEEENIKLMYEAVVEQMSKIPEYDFEIIFADNDSSDDSQNILRTIAANDSRVKVILNQYNCGVNKSTVNLYKNSSGDAFIGIPCDFQEPPEMIPEFISYWEQGYDVVWGQKNKSKEFFIKYICRQIYYEIIDLFSDSKQLHQVTGFGLMDKNVLRTLLVTQFQDSEYNSRHLISEYGFKIKLIPYTQRARERGKSSYNIYSYFNFAITSLCNTSIKPLRLMTIVGMIVAFFSLLVAAFYFVYKILHWDSFAVGTAPLVIGMFFMSSVQLFCIGILGEYVAILIRRVTNRPLVIEKEKINFEKEE